jgi:hypothetical protein
MTKWKSYKPDFILLAEAGFIAVNQSDEDSAMKLFRAAHLLDAKNVLPKIGFGYLHLHKLELSKACKEFEEVLELDPSNEMAKAFLGICMGLQPQGIAKGEKILEQTLKSKDPMIKQLSDTAIGFIDRFVKKKGGPAGEGRKK